MALLNHGSKVEATPFNLDTLASDALMLSSTWIDGFRVITEVMLDFIHLVKDESSKQDRDRVMNEPL